MSAKQPAFQFYPGDWMRDPAVRMCCPATRGIYVDVLCLMHENDRSGIITGSIESLARATGSTVEEMQHAIEDFERHETINIVRNGDGELTFENRRMAREHAARKDAAVRQARHRDKGGGDPDRWAAIRVQILERDQHMCAYCGRRANTVDHVTPKSRGGDESFGNLVACCKRCNNKKSKRTPEESGMSFWRGFDQSKLLNAKEKQKRNNKITSYSSSSTSNTSLSTSIPDTDRLKKDHYDGAFAPAPRNAVPYDAIVDLYHSVLPELRRVMKVSEQRKRAMNARWHNDAASVEEWRTFFERVRKSPFLMGRVDGRNGQPPFMADFDWLLKPTNFIAVAEGKYFERRSKPT